MKCSACNRLIDLAFNPSEKCFGCGKDVCIICTEYSSVPSTENQMPMCPNCFSLRENSLDGRFAEQSIPFDSDAYKVSKHGAGVASVVPILYTLSSNGKICPHCGQKVLGNHGLGKLQEEV